MELVDKRILKLRELLPVFLDETFTSSKYLMFQDELFYKVLCKYISNWCKGLGLPLKIIRRFESTLEKFWPFFMDWVEMVCNFFHVFSYWLTFYCLHIYLKRNKG